MDFGGRLSSSLSKVSSSLKRPATFDLRPSRIGLRSEVHHLDLETREIVVTTCFLTKRERFAMAAMQGMLAFGGDIEAEDRLRSAGFEPGARKMSDAVAISVAHAAVKMADALIAELSDEAEHVGL